MDALEQLQRDLQQILLADPALQYTTILLARPRIDTVVLTNVTFAKNVSTITCDPFANIAVGQAIAGFGLQPGTTIAGLGVGSLTLSLPTLFPLTAGTLTVTIPVGAPQIKQQQDNALSGLLKRNGKGGTAILLLMPTETPETLVEAGHSAPVVQRITVQVSENTTINLGADGTGTSCESLANQVFTDLQGYGPSGGPRLYLSERGKYWIPTATNVTYQLQFERKTTRPLPKRCEKPVLKTQSNGQITLSCSTPLATIWYTTDGTWPSPTNPSAQEFALVDPSDGDVLVNPANNDPLTGAMNAPSSGTTLRAVAYAYPQGYAPSWPLDKTF